MVRLPKKEPIKACLQKRAFMLRWLACMSQVKKMFLLPVNDLARAEAGFAMKLRPHAEYA